MKLMNIALDPLICDALDALGADQKQSRGDLIRDILYTYVWHASHADPIPLQRALGWPLALRSEARLRLVRNGDQSKIVTVNGWGIKD